MSHEPISDPTRLATEKGRKALLPTLSDKKERLELYKTHRPYRDEPRKTPIQPKREAYSR